MFREPSNPEHKTPAPFEKRSQFQASLEVENRQCPVQDVATIGRAPGSDVLLADPSVSRNHARIFQEGGHYWLKDLSSANGTQLNGKKIKVQMLADGDKISFGEAKAIFHVSGIASGPASIGSDPLEGAIQSHEDGTPTGGLVGKYGTSEELRIRQLEHELEEARKQLAARDREIESWRARAAVVRPAQNTIWNVPGGFRSEDIDSGRTAQLAGPPDSPALENERLQKLVRHLERALADSNMRIKNLQERLRSTPD